MAKKKQETLNELDNAGQHTAALDTLQPNSRPVDDPKTRFEAISRVIGALATVTDEDLNNFASSLAQIGHEADQIPDGSAAHNAATIAMKPSDASASVKEAIKADIEKILASGEGLSEEFKTKAATLFETAVNTQVHLKELELQAEFDKQIDESTTEIIATIAEELDNYLDFAAKNWMEENHVAVESSLRNEIYDDFIAGLKSLFEEHYISIPEEKVDVCETLAEKVDELETRLNEMIQENADLRSVVEDYSRKEIVDKVCEGLTLSEAEKLREMADGVEADDADSLKKKLDIIKESTFVKKGSNGAKVINETLEAVTEGEEGETKGTEDKPTNPEDVRMSRYADVISRTTRKYAA